MVVPIWRHLLGALLIHICGAHPIAAAPGICAVDESDCFDDMGLLQGWVETPKRKLKEVPSQAFSTHQVRQVAFHSNLALGASGQGRRKEMVARSGTGADLNGEGDLEAFLLSLTFTVGLSVTFLLRFSSLRLRCPAIYCGNDQPDQTQVKDRFFCWIRASLETNTDDNVKAIGLDNGMLLEFNNLAMQILAMTGLPMFFIVGPLNCGFGGHVAGVDRLSYLSMGNVERGSWLYLLHAACVWGVVLTVETCVYGAMAKFIERRRDWLGELSPLRASTVMVGRIPEEWRSDAKLREFFNTLKVFKGKVKSAYVTKDTTELTGLVREQESTMQARDKAETLWADYGKAPLQRPTMRVADEVVDTIHYFSFKIHDLGDKIKSERKKIRKKAEEVGCKNGGVNLNNGFVTFSDRAEAEVAKQLYFSQDKQEWILSSPPPPRDILWDDLTQDASAENFRMLIGYSLLAGLFLVYAACVVGIAILTSSISLNPWLQPLWRGLVPALALEIMVASLPGLLLLIFGYFFTLKAATFAQCKLQRWYFWFEIFLLVLFPVIGQDFVASMKEVGSDPVGIFGMMADNLPLASHFYMNFLTVQWVSHARAMVRHAVYVRFKTLNAMYEEKDAKAMAEPEDQIYYGIGTRSACWSITLVISIVYGTVSPPIMILGLLTFAMNRVLYGYLIPFAETRKPDLGGVFWVTMLQHTFVGCLLYCALMSGILARRGHTWWPSAIAAAAIPYVFWSWACFQNEFSWESLPFVENRIGSEEPKKYTFEGTYEQPELQE